MCDVYWEQFWLNSLTAVEKPFVTEEAAQLK